MLFWEGVLDAETYDVEIEESPDVWQPVASDVAGLQYELTNLPVGEEVRVRVVAKNKYGRGAESEVVSYEPMRNLALPGSLGGATPPSEYVYLVSRYDVTSVNNGQYDDSNDSCNGRRKDNDSWGYTKC